MGNIIKGYLIPEQQKKPEFVAPILPEQGAKFMPLINCKVAERLEAYKAEAARLKSDIPKNSDPNIIDAYNKGRLYTLESVIKDLEIIMHA